MLYGVAPLELLLFVACTGCVSLLANQWSRETADPERMHLYSISYNVLEHQDYDYYQSNDAIVITHRRLYSYAQLEAHLRLVQAYVGSLQEDSFFASANQSYINSTSHVMTCLLRNNTSFYRKFTLADLTSIPFRSIINKATVFDLLFKFDPEKKLFLGFKYELVSGMVIDVHILTEESLGRSHPFREDWLGDRTYPHYERHSYSFGTRATLLLLVGLSTLGLCWEVRLVRFYE